MSLPNSRSSVRVPPKLGCSCIAWLVGSIAACGRVVVSQVAAARTFGIPPRLPGILHVEIPGLDEVLYSRANHIDCDPGNTTLLCCLTCLSPN